jgi:hypothetical protein
MPSVAPPSIVPGSRLRRGTQLAGVTLDELIVRGERIHLWRGPRADGALVTVHALVDEARPREIDHFLAAARRLAALTSSRPIHGLVHVIMVVPSERLYVALGSAAGTMEDVGLLGWGLRDSVKFARRLGRGLYESHRHGIVHGCLRPANVLLDDGLEPRLSDVGAIVLDDSYDGPSDQKHDYARYAALEVRQGAAARVRSDVFSLGRLIDYLLSGEHPRLDDSDVPRLAHLERQPPGLVRIVRKATLRDPRERYGSIEELITDLEHYADKDRVGVGHEGARELDPARLSTPPSWRPPDSGERGSWTAGVLRRGAKTPRELPRRGAGTPRELPGQGAGTSKDLPRRGAATPRELPRRGAGTPRDGSRFPLSTAREAPIPTREGEPSSRPTWRAYHSVPPPPVGAPPSSWLWLSGGAGALLGLVALTGAYVAGASSALLATLVVLGAAGASLLVPPLGPPWLSRLAAALLLALAAWVFEPTAAAAFAGRRAKLERGSPIERGLRLSELWARGNRDFRRIDLSGADFTGLDLGASRFDEANLRGARFTRARLAGASMREADVAAADFSEADLTGVEVTTVQNFRESRCDEATLMPERWRCHEGSPEPISMFER